MDSSTFASPDPVSDALPQTPAEGQPAFQRAALYEAAAAGKVVVDVGGVVSPGAAVVNDQEKSAASALPAVSVIPTAPPDRVAVYVVDALSGAVGCNVAAEPLADTDATTDAPPGSRNTNVLDVTLEGAIGSLKLAIRSVVVPTPDAPAGGVTLDTVGGVDDEEHVDAGDGGVDVGGECGGEGAGAGGE